MLFQKNNKNLLEVGVYGFGRLFRLKVNDWQRVTHSYVLGKTGSGKSKLIEHILFQDIIHGRGCGVLDPHSDLADDLIMYLHDYPEFSQPHWKRIIYFDPSRDDHLIPFNVLNSGFTPYETSQNVVEAFRRAWPEELKAAPRFANIATHCILTLIENNLTLLELPRLLTNKEFRGALLENIENKELLSFWYDRYEKWGREGPLMTESLLNKVTAFTINPQLRRILGANKNLLDFRKIMDEEKVLIINLGRCDVETRRLVGSLIVTGMEQAARSRRDVHAERKPFYFAIDEFQDFCSNDGAAQTLAQILSECRKFGLHLLLAHQTLSQISKRMEGALGNIQLKIIFGISRQDAEILVKHLFRVSGETVKHTVKDTAQQERSHPIFYSLVEGWEKGTQLLEDLPARYAYVKTRDSRGVKKIKTMPVKHRPKSENQLEKIKRRILHFAGTPVKIIESEIHQRLSNFEYYEQSEQISFKETVATS